MERKPPRPNAPHHPCAQAAVQEQAGKLCHVSNLYHTEPGATLARRLVVRDSSIHI